MHKTGKTNIIKNKKIAERVDQCIDDLVEAFEPEKIILFGSYARGKTTSAGTLDFIIVADTELDFFSRIKKAMLTCSGGFPSIEPLVYTPNEFREFIEYGEGFIEDALEEGIVLYDKRGK